MAVQQKNMKKFGYCPKCGAKNPVGAKSCSKCGAKFPVFV